MHIHTQSIVVSKEDMAHIEAFAGNGRMRCSCCGGTSWDPPEPRLAIVNEVRLGGKPEKEPPTVVLSINCSKCGKRESFDYHRLAAYSKAARGSLRERLRLCIRSLKSSVRAATTPAFSAPNQ